MAIYEEYDSLIIILITDKYKEKKANYRFFMPK